MIPLTDRAAKKIITSRDHAILVPQLSLPAHLHYELIEHIHTNRVIKSTMGRVSQPTMWKKLTDKILLGRGRFQVYRLEDDIEKRIRQHYSEFLSTIPVPAKLRLKSCQHVNLLEPHSDAYDGGDTASLTIGILTNGEITNWYNAGKEYTFGAFNWTKLKRQTSLTLGDNDACLFNNSAVHSVTDCKSSDSRYVLTIGWQNLSFEELVEAWINYANHDISN
jgi:hypothetical protein